MKQPNTLPELLRHAADLAEKGCDDFDGKFESKHFTFGNNNPSWKLWTYVGLPNFNDSNEWRIADKEPTTFEMKVGDKVFVLNKPYMSAPEIGNQYACIQGDGDIYWHAFNDDECDAGFLSQYNCWRTEADAKAYAEAKLARDKFEIGEIK
jgi:hypothetical protein